MKSGPVAPAETIYTGNVNATRDDARGASTLLAHQMLGSFALGTNPTNTKTLTLTINGTAVVVTFVSSIGSTANNVLIGASAAATLANLLNFLQNPSQTNTTQVAATTANQTLLSYLWYASTGTTLAVGSMNKATYGPLTSFSASTTATSDSFTGNTMALYVEPGVCYVNGTEVYFAGGISPTVTAPSSHPRIDVLTIDNTGTLAWTTGTENASPVAPTYPANKIPICELYNVVSETVLYDNDNQTSGGGYVYNDVRPFLDYVQNPTAFASNLIPDADGTRNLGSSGTEWNNVYAKSGIYVAGAGVAIAKFGGSGADGALTQTSGTTTISVSSALFYVKNYASISLTGTANLTISGPSNNGTILVLKSQGNVTLTSSGTVINLASLGAAATYGAVSTLVPWNTVAQNGGNGTGGSSTQGPAIGGTAGFADIGTIVQVGRMIPITCGGGGGNGGSADTGFGGTTYGGGGGGGGGTVVCLYNTLTANSGTVTIAGGTGASTTSNSSAPPGGGGGGALYIECGGALNFTGTISVAGGNATYNTSGGSGGNGTSGGSGQGGNGDTQSNTAGSGGAGGSGGWNAANGNTGSGGGGGASGTYYFGVNNSFS